MSDGTNPQPGLDRRRFLELGGTLTFGSVVAALLFQAPLRKAVASLVYPEPDYTPLDGACIEAQTDEERTVAAIVDTVVPGSKSDPAGIPGALDCCALNLIYDAFYPFVDSLPVILPMVDSFAERDHGLPFRECDLDQRTGVLSEVEELLPFIRLAYRFIRSAFYGAAYTMRGTHYVKWPGPNLGYQEHPDFSFREAVSRELTEDGNLP